MKIVLVGASLNSGNRGVNALTRGQINLILDTFGVNTEITILSYTVRQIVKNQVYYNGFNKFIDEKPCSDREALKGYLLCLVNKQNHITEELRDAKYIFDISEGDSFSDIYGPRRFIQHSLIKLIALCMKKTLIIMPQTIGPFDRWWVKIIAKYILRRADEVFARDNLSKSYVNDSLRVKRKVSLSPDMAFYMEPDNTISLNRFLREDNSIKVGLNVSALLYNGGYTGDNMFGFKADYKKLIDDLIIQFSKKGDVKLILIPHVMTESYEVEDDFRVCQSIAERMEKDFGISIAKLDKYYREDEIKAIISGCDFFIGSRMHACIAAISTKVPTVPIAYSRKFMGIWDDMGLGFCITNPKVEDENLIIKRVLEIFNQRDQVKSILTQVIPLQREKITKMIDKIEVSANE